MVDDNDVADVDVDVDDDFGSDNVTDVVAIATKLW